MSERALTIRQPWADLVVAGVKDVENRTWPVPSTLPCQCLDMFCDRPRDERHHPFPFRLWVHAGQQWSEGITQHPTALFWSEYGPTRTRFPARDDRRMGVLLGSVTVTGCHHADDCEHYKPDNHCSRWAEPDVWHWTLADPLPLHEPPPMRGAQGLWTLTFEQVTQVVEQMCDALLDDSERT